MTCQQAKDTTTCLGGLLQPLLILRCIWDNIAMDFIYGLALSKGFSVIFIVVDGLSKYGHFMVLGVGYMSTVAKEVFINNIVKLHGILRSIVSDRDRAFINHFWQHLFQLMGMTLAMPSIYYPQYDGQTEDLNKWMDLYLRCFTSENPEGWPNLLPWSELW